MKKTRTAESSTMPPRSRRSVLELCMTDYNLIVSPKGPWGVEKSTNGNYPQSRVFRIPCLQGSEAFRRGKPANLRPGGESARPRTQLRGGSQCGRRSGPGDGDGAGPEGVESDSHARDCRALRSSFFELRSAAFRPAGADDGEHRARHLAAAGTAVE